LNRAFLAALAVLVALAAVVAGCGGGGDSTTDSTTVVLTKTEFIKQGDAICKEATENNQSEAEDFAKENDFELEKASKDQLEEAIAEVLAPSLGKQAEELEALGAPEGDEQKVEDIIAAVEDAAGEIEDDPSLAFEEGTLKKANQLAKAYGFKVCGEG
jgi:hypothetical protein